MARFDQLENMYDVGLKPVMLRSLIRQYLPAENHPLNLNNSCFKLPSLVSILQTHSLLSELDSQSIDPKLINTWKSAVDDWLSCLLSLLSSDMSDKCWVGICLLGVTCQECSNQRFLSSYSVWLNKLLSHIQPPADSQLVKIASCTSLADLLIRLARFPEVKKDGNLLAGKLVQPVLKLLNEDNVEAVWEGAANLLYALIAFFPASIHHYYDKVEAAIASKILSGKYSTKTLKKLGYCLALLPKAKGDKDNWSLMMQKILISINDHLNEAFQGVEEVLSMLALVERLLRVDGSLPHTMLPFMTSVQQELICSELPVLHAYGLELLIAIIKGMRRQLLPHSAYIVRVVTRYFKRCSLPELRIKLYSIIRMLLVSMGVGIAIFLAPDVIENASNDLNSLGGEDIETSPANTGPATGALPQLSNRKRKHGAKTGSLEEKQDAPSPKVGESNTHQMTPNTVKIAALDTLEVLLTVGAASKSESWRSSIDSLLMKTAINSCKRGWGNLESNIFLPHESASVWADFQFSSLRALLTSFLAPARVRPPYLSQGLELFRRGKQEAGMKLAQFCSYALFALEVLIHPRALPLDDFYSACHKSTDGASNRFLENIYSGSQKQNTLFLSSMWRTEQGGVESHDDDLYDRWLQNENENQNKKENENIPVEDMKDQTSRPNDSSFTNVLEVREQEPAAASADVLMRTENESVVQPWHLEESVPKSQEVASAKAVMSPAVGTNPGGCEIESKTPLSASDRLNDTNHDMFSFVDKVDGFDNVAGKTSSTFPNAEKGSSSMHQQLQVKLRGAQ
ncbi:proline-, glutamic acid and leucine-rich protein 1 [Gossypium australe]|uniref:Proline-, glutamic acid and leucine-rich protein 1 n=1 Tax=Gossypium australe TaxID=47621 RepID=A0A5B6W9U8_9ROSI|nr:proline-, glutamic acid and leucine-rich protein 1 [Gossypium australe]